MVSSNLYLNYLKMIYILQKSYLLECLSDFADQLDYEFLLGEGDDTCRKIVKEYFTFVKLDTGVCITCVRKLFMIKFKI